MKTFKKLFSVAAIVALLGTLVPYYAFGATYTSELEDAYKYAYANGVTTMSSIENADMYGNLTRIAMAKMMANYAINTLGLTPDTSLECSFPDVSAALNSQYDNGVTKACQLGLMGQNITNFNPNGIVTRAEFGTTLSRALNANSADLEDMNKADPYYKEHLNFLKDEGIMTKIDTPNQVEVRGYVMLMMMRADTSYDANKTQGCSAEELLACISATDFDACIAACSDEADEDEDVAGNGFATISRVGSATTQTVAANAVAKKIGTIKLTAGEEDTIVSSITISKRGLANGDVKFFMEKNGVRVSTKATLKTNKTSVSVRFSPAITIKAGKSETFDIVADFLNVGVNSSFEFSVSDLNVANGKSEGTPVSLGTVNTASYTVGTIAAPTMTAGDSLQAGDTDKVLATVNVILPTKETKFDGFVITKDSGKEDLYNLVKNVKAYYNGQEVGTVTVDAEKLVVSNLNIVKSNAETVSIELRADPIFVGNTENFSLKIDDNDVIAYETNTNERLASTATAASLGLSISGVNLTADSLVTASQTVAPGTSGIELFKAKVTSTADFDVTNYTLTFDTPANVTSGNFTSLIAYVNGADYELDLDNGATGWTFTKDDAFSLGKSMPATIRVVGNLTSTSTPGATYKLTLALQTGRNDNNVDLDLSTISVIGHSTTVNNGGFTLTRQSDMPTNKTVLEGSAENVLYFKLRANAEDQIMKSLVVTAAGSSITTGINEVVSRLDLMKGSTVVKSITNSSDLSGMTATFSNINERLVKDTDTNYTIRATLKGGEVTALGKTLGFSIAAAGSVSVVRASNTAVPTTTASAFPYAGTSYYIASNAPTVEITDQNAKNTFVTFTNNSSYYVELTGVTLELTRNKAEGTAGYVAWNGTVSFLDAINGNVISSTGTVPGTEELILSSAYQNLDSTLNYVVELNDPQNTITADDYNVVIKGLQYRFVDKTTGSGSTRISETYNVTE